MKRASSPGIPRKVRSTRSITNTTSRFGGRIFGYGNVDIQTAAELGETSYQLIHHPKLLKDTITHAQEEYKRMQISNQATQLAEAIAKTNAHNPRSR